MTKAERIGKVAIIISREVSSWRSCQIITPNLEKAYNNLLGEQIKYFSFAPTTKPPEVWKLSEDIFEWRPDRIVFLDHVPHPGQLLQALGERYKKFLPPLFFHVYGDFTLYANQWLANEYILKRAAVRFICASPRQVRLVSRFLMEPDEAVMRCHFPVDTNDYHPDEQMRMAWRQKLGVRDDEFFVLYAGRISLQKNITRLTREILNTSAITNIPVKFFLAGTFDDLGAPFFGVNLGRGFYNQYWARLLESLPPEMRERVTYLGQFEKEELKGLYNAADLYMSLSLHHDEDYGMAPAEALCSGTPVILTDWGGYSSFYDGNDQACSLVPVQITSHGLSIAGDPLRRAFFAKASTAFDAATREQIAKESAARLSIEAAQELIAAVHLTKPPFFSGFNWRLQKFKECFDQPVAFPAGPKKNTFYEEIYGAYTNSKG